MSEVTFGACRWELERECVVSSLSRRCDMGSGNGRHDGGVVTGAVSVMTLE